MKFVISRTSVHDDGQPCAEAFREVVQPTDARGQPREVWMVELATLEEVLGFVDRYETIVLSRDAFFPVPHSIEIYDDYRE